MVALSHSPASPALISGPQTPLQAGRSYFRPRVWSLPSTTACCCPELFQERQEAEGIICGGKLCVPPAALPPVPTSLWILAIPKAHRVILASLSPFRH